MSVPPIPGSDQGAATALCCGRRVWEWHAVRACASAWATFV